MARKAIATVINQEEVAAGVYLLLLRQSEIANEAKPGQFVHIHCNFAENTLLRRPISIHTVDPDKGSVSLLYKAIGRGTRYLATLKSGDSVDLLGPLGNSFPVEGKKPLIIGGGMGVAPLLLLTKKLLEKGCNPTLALGFSDSTAAQMARLYHPLTDNIKICTMDGSVGFKGTVLDALRQSLNIDDYDVIYACGPKGMLQSLPETSSSVYVSLEEYMACGVGACLGCAVPLTSGGYKHVCKDGPVFDIREVMLNE